MQRDDHRPVVAPERRVRSCRPDEPVGRHVPLKHIRHATPCVRIKSIRWTQGAVTSTFHRLSSTNTTHTSGSTSVAARLEVQQLSVGTFHQPSITHRERPRVERIETVSLGKRRLGHRRIEPRYSQRLLYL